MNGNREVIQARLDLGKVKEAMTCASILEGETRRDELEFILDWCIKRGRLMDAYRTAKLIDRRRELSVEELGNIFEFFKTAGWANMLAKLYETDNVPSVEEFFRITAPYADYLKEQQARLKRA